MAVTERQQIDNLMKRAKRLVSQYQEFSPELNNIYGLMLWSPIFLSEAEAYFQQMLDVIGGEVYGEEPSQLES